MIKKKTPKQNKAKPWEQERFLSTSEISVIFKKYIKVQIKPKIHWEAWIHFPIWKYKNSVYSVEIFEKANAFLQEKSG